MLPPKCPRRRPGLPKPPRSSIMSVGRSCLQNALPRPGLLAAPRPMSVSGPDSKMRYPIPECSLPPKCPTPFPSAFWTPEGPKTRHHGCQPALDPPAATCPAAQAAPFPRCSKRGSFRGALGCWHAAGGSPGGSARHAPLTDRPPLVRGGHSSFCRLGHGPSHNFTRDCFCREKMNAVVSCQGSVGDFAR